MPELIGYILTLDALFTWGIASLVYKYGLGKTQPKATLFFRILIVTLGTFIFALIFGDFSFFFSFTSQELVGFLIVSILSGVSVTIGDLCYFKALKKIDASRAYPLTQLSLVFVYPLAFIFFGEQVTLSILIGGAFILLSVFILSTKDNPNIDISNSEVIQKANKNLIVGVLLSIGTAFLWAISYVSFNQARIISNEVIASNFVRIALASIFVATLGFFKRDYYEAFKKENKPHLKYYLYIGIAGALSLGLADSLFIMAAEVNGLVLTATITANTPMVQQILAILILKEKFRKRFLIAVLCLILGNYIILFF